MISTLLQLYASPAWGERSARGWKRYRRNWRRLVCKSVLRITENRAMKQQCSSMISKTSSL